MRHTDAEGWRIRTDGLDQYLTTLMYLRDAAGLTAPADYPLPPLAPAVPLHAQLAPHATANAAETWSTWWEQCLTPGRRSRLYGFGPRLMEPPEPGTDLRTLFDTVVDEAHDWFRERTAEFHERSLRRRADPDAPGRTVRRIERELGRASAPFSLDVLMLPLARKWGRRVDADVVVVSELLWFDEDACDQFLDPVLRKLM